MNWEEAKEILGYMDFPKDDPETFSMYKDGTSHYQRGDKVPHSLDCYKKEIKVKGFDGLAIYRICNKCKGVRNKSMVIFNDKSNLSYTVDFIKRGETAY